MRRPSDHQNADSEPAPPRPGAANEHSGACTSQQDHPVPKAQQTPRRFVRKDAVGHRQDEGVEGEETEKRGVSAGEPGTHKTRARADDSKDEDGRLGPHGPTREMKKQQPMEIEMPGMNVS